MKKFTISGVLVVSLGTLSSQAAFFFQEGFDSAGSADVTVNADADTTLTYVDYSNFTVGGTTFNLPEAPNQVAGSANTTGILLQANSAGAGAAANIVAGATAMNFTGDYHMSFDAWLNTGAVSGATEQLLWGIGTDSAAPIESRVNRNGGTSGVWGWLAGDNGYGTEDASIFEDGTELADLGDTQTGEDGFFNSAFSNELGGTNSEAGFEWVDVDVIAEGGNVSLYFNNTLFFSESGLTTDGFAMIGYEDPFGSVSDGDVVWGVLDNFAISDDLTIPEPSSALLSLLAASGLLLRRRR